jgi:hypothetical protein
LPSEKQSFPATGALGSLVRCALFQAPNRFSVSLQIFIQKVLYRGILLLPLGILVESALF